MTERYTSPQDVEDAFYDAIEERDWARFQGVWEASPEIACLLPMHTFVYGERVHALWKPLFESGMSMEIQVRHIRWVETERLAIHYLEERISFPDQPPQPPLLATHIFREGPTGWRLILHQNAPAPTPPGAPPMPG